MRADSRDASGGEDEAKTEAIDAFRAVPHDSLDQLTPDQFVPAKRVFPAAGSVPEDAPVGATKHLPKFIIPDSLAKDVATGLGRA